MFIYRQRIMWEVGYYGLDGRWTQDGVYPTQLDATNRTQTLNGNEEVPGDAGYPVARFDKNICPGCGANIANYDEMLGAGAHTSSCKGGSLWTK